VTTFYQDSWRRPALNVNDNDDVYSPFRTVAGRLKYKKISYPKRDRKSAFVIDTVKIRLTSGSIITQNLVGVTRTVCGHVGDTENFGQVRAPPVSNGGVGPVADLLETRPNPT